MIVLIKLIVIVFIFIFGVSPLFAGTYWVSPTGSAPWINCQSATDPGSNYCALPTANRNAVAGDTVYLKGGIYTIDDATYGRYSGAIMPSHSGTGVGTGSIIFAAAPGETPMLSQSSGSMIAGIMLGGVVTNNYIKVDGITFKNNSYYFGNISNYSSYNEITNCTFTRDAGATEIGSPFVIRGGLCSPNYNCWATNNWIHGNTFSTGRSSNPCGEATDLLLIGNAWNPSGNLTDTSDNYNTIEDNYFEYAAHTPIDTYSRFNVIKNNIIHNEPWITGCTTSPFIPTYVNSSYNGKYGHRLMQLSDDYGYPGTYLLVEGNRLGHASTNPGNAGPMSLDVAAPENIIRYNFLYNGMQSGIYFKYANLDPALHSGGPGGINNRIYNNTIYHTGYGYDWKTYGGGNYSGHGIAQWNYAAPTPTNNVIKNNIVYDSANGDICGLWAATPCSPTAYDTIINNWLTVDGDPKFVNPDVTDTRSRILPNLALQSTSPAINGGTYLTQVNGAGTNSTTLVVDDALYFQDGTWGSALARGVTLFPDWIAIGTVGNVVQISSINYSTNTITLKSPMTWSNGAKIWLYKKSDGSRVLFGSAPDYGAHEFDPSASQTLNPPQNLRINR
jgi:hypothetical protein